MHLPAALLFFPDRTFADRLEMLLDEIRVVSMRAWSPDDVARLVSEVSPDVMLLDLDRPGRETGRLLSALDLVAAHVPILWFGSSTGQEATMRVRRAGARGLLGKEADPIQMVRAIRTVLRGEAFFPEINTFPATPGAKGVAESERLLRVLGKASS